MIPVRGEGLENSGHPVKALQIVYSSWLVVPELFGLNWFNDRKCSDILESSGERFPQDIPDG